MVILHRQFLVNKNRQFSVTKINKIKQVPVKKKKRKKRCGSETLSKTKRLCGVKSKR